jgi:hypothetical protein
MAKAISAVSAHYDMGATQKSLDWGNLFMVVAGTYGGMFFAVKKRKADGKKKTLDDIPSVYNIGLTPAENIPTVQ